MHFLMPQDDSHSGVILRTLAAMDEALMIPVTYNSHELWFPFRIITSGFARRYEVLVDDVPVVFEKDDAGAYRAVVYDADTLSKKLPERGLLEAITSVIEQLSL